MDRSTEEMLRTTEMLHEWAEAKTRWEAEGKRIQALAQELRYRTAAAWVGTVHQDEDGRDGGEPWPVSVEVPDERRKLVGKSITVTIGRRDPDMVTFEIGGPEASYGFSDGSGRVIYRAFSEKADAEQWVKDRITRKRP